MHLLNKLRLLAVAGLTLSMAARSSAAFSYFDTFYDTDWTSISIGGMRGVGTENLALSGVSGTVTGAYLFWHGPTNSLDLNANATVGFDGTSITGVNIGISQDNNWGYSNSQAYRANVTSLVTGDASYSLTDFVKNAGNINVNGVSLFVLFDDGDTGNNRDLVLFNGNDSNVASSFDPVGWDVALNGIDYTSGNANIRLSVSDGQDFGNDEGIFVNDAPLVALSPNWQGDLGVNIVGNGSLWDEKTFDLTPALSVGINNIRLRTYTPLTDALSLVVAAIDLPAGSAPPPPDFTPVPEPSTYGLMGALGLVGIAAFRRRKVAAKS